MKKKFLSGFIAAALLLPLMYLSSCQYSMGVKKDLSTGLKASYNGLDPDDIFLTGDENMRLTSNIIEPGSEINVVATGVENYEVKDGRVFPGCQIILTDKDNNELLHLPDAFADLPEGKSKQEATMLTATLTTGSPMQSGETYHLFVKFWDKLKSSSHITAEVDLVMKQESAQ
jgi:hypothetical protein